jgi:hypothetical protein
MVEIEIVASFFPNLNKCHSQGRGRDKKPRKKRVLTTEQKKARSEAQSRRQSAIYKLNDTDLLTPSHVGGVVDVVLHERDGCFPTYDNLESLSEIAEAVCEALGDDARHEFFDLVEPKWWKSNPYIDAGTCAYCDEPIQVRFADVGYKGTWLDELKREYAFIPTFCSVSCSNRARGEAVSVARYESGCLHEYGGSRRGCDCHQFRDEVEEIYV